MTSVLLISLLGLCLVDLSIVDSGVLKSPTISVCGLMCNSNFVSFTYRGALDFGLQMFRIETSS